MLVTLTPLCLTVLPTISGTRKFLHFWPSLTAFKIAERTHHLRSQKWLWQTVACFEESGTRKTSEKVKMRAPRASRVSVRRAERQLVLVEWMPDGGQARCKSSEDDGRLDALLRASRGQARAIPRRLHVVFQTDSPRTVEKKVKSAERHRRRR